MRFLGVRDAVERVLFGLAGKDCGLTSWKLLDPQGKIEARLFILLLFGLVLSNAAVEFHHPKIDD